MCYCKLFEEAHCTKRNGHGRQWERSYPQTVLPRLSSLVAVTNSGLNKQHDPVASRCPGSCRPPSFLNHQKSEVSIYTNPATAVPILSVIPGAQVMDPASVTLLGYPIGDLPSITFVINEKIHHLTTMGDRLQHLSAQDALLLLHP